MSSIVASSETVRFRRMTRADIDYVLSLEQTAAEEELVSKWSWEQHERGLQMPSRLHLIIETVADDRAVGFVLLDGMDSAEKNIEFQRIVIEPRGQGHGRQSVRLLKQYIFDELGAHRLWLDVKDFNTQARTLYESEGFVEEGSTEGESLIVMSILRDQQSTSKARS